MPRTMPCGGATFLGWGRLFHPARPGQPRQTQPPARPASQGRPKERTGRQARAGKPKASQSPDPSAQRPAPSTQHPAPTVLWALCLVLVVLGLGLWGLGSGPWALGSGLWALGLVLGNLGSGLSPVDVQPCTLVYHPWRSILHSSPVNWCTNQPTKTVTARPGHGHG